MIYRHRRLLCLLLLVSLVGSALTLSGCAPTVRAEQPAGERSITVLGQGSVTAKPDLAVVQLGIESLAATVAEASQENNATMAAIMAKLQELNIAEKDIQTSNLSISSVNYGMDRGDSAGDQYRVSNMVQIKVRDVERVGPVLDAVIEAGVNQVHGVSFTVDEPQALEDQARAKAVEDAGRRAEALADLTGLSVGKVIQISEGGSSVPLFGGGLVYGRGAAAADAGMPVSPGEVEITYQVQVTYAIE